MKRGPTDADYEILDRETVYAGFFRMERYRLRHRLYAGEISAAMSRELFERGHAAAVLLYDPVADAVVLQEQFRVGALDDPGGPWLWEIVAGMIESGEAPEEVVRREALEEAGATVGQLAFICEYLSSPGGTSERISLYCGQVDSRELGGVHGLAEEHEDIRVEVVPYAQAWEMWLQGEINSASAIIALQWLAMQRDALRLAWASQEPDKS